MFQNESMISINTIDNIIVVNLNTELSKDILENVQLELLEKFIDGKSYGVVIDVSGVMIIDRIIASHIKRIVESIQMMGGVAVLTGLKPEVVLSLLSTGVDFSKINTFLNINMGIRNINSSKGNVLTVKEDYPDEEVEATEEKSETEELCSNQSTDF